jgi:acetyl esterase/lipase
MTEGPARYLPPAFEVHVVDDVVFGQAPNVDGHVETLRLDLYLPVDDPAPLRPAIMWFHGGGFRPGNDKRQIYVPWFAEAFASRGYVGIAPDYRVRADPMSDLEGTVRDAVADARMALAWVRAQSHEYHIDPHRVALAGGSAGGMVVLNLCHDPERPVDKQRDGMFAILDMWGTPGGRTRLFESVNPDSPPTLLIHGTADTLVAYDWSRKLAEELKRAGVDCFLLTLPDAPHTPLMHMERIMATMARFLREHLGGSVPPDERV